MQDGSRAAETVIKGAVAGRPRRAWLAVGVALAAAFLYAFAIIKLHALAPQEDVLALRDASLSVVGHAGPDTAKSAREVVLPSRWRDDCPGCLSAWYEFAIDSISARKDLVLYAPRADDEFAVYVNGDMLDAGGLAPTGAPRLIGVPAAALAPLSDRLLILLTAHRPGSAFLSELYLGEAQHIVRFYRLRNLLQPGAARFALVFCAIVAFLLAALWAQRRESGSYAWLAGLAMLWAIVLAENLIPGSSNGERVIHASAVALLAICSCGFAMHGARESNVSLRWSLIVVGSSVLLLGVSVLLPAHTLDAILPVFESVFLVVLALAQIPTIVFGATRFTRAVWPICVAALVAFFALRDAAVAAGVLRTVDASLLAFAAPAYVGAFAWLLLTRFFDSVRSTEALNVQLDRLVHDKTREIEQQYHEMQILQGERMIAEERERIMHDMHDGVGGQLVSALAMIDRGKSDAQELRDALTDALTDMRLMIDSLDSVHDDLNAVLAMFRDRMQPRLSAAGVDLKWHVEDLPPLAGLGPSSVLGILRIMQETVTNTLKHSGAEIIVVTARETDADASVEIALQDDGCGFDPASVAGGGHGLRNIRKRALENHIELEIDATPGQGTRVSMCFGRGDSELRHGHSHG